MAITVSTEVQGLLGISATIPSALLTLADRWVASKMQARGLSVPTTATDAMKLSGAFICCAFYIDSKASDKSWNQSVNLAGASFTRSDAAKMWEQRARDEVDAMAKSSADMFEIVTYTDESIY